MTDIAWTPELRAQVDPTRESPNPARLKTHLHRIGSVEWAVPIDPAHAWENMRSWNKSRELERAQKGLAKADAHVRRITERAIAARRDDEPPTGPLDVDVEAAQLSFHFIHSYSATPWWIAREDETFAMRALVRYCQLQPSWQTHGYGSGMAWLEETWDGRWKQIREASLAWNILRCSLAACDAKTWKTARKQAEKIMKTAPLEMRCVLAFLFAHRAWANAAAQQVVDEDAFYGWHIRALTTVADLALGEQLLLAPKKKDLWLSPEDHLTLLAHQGPDAARLLGLSFRRARRNDQRKAYAQTLAIVETEQAAAIFAEHIANKAIGPIAKKYFQRLPALANAALAPLASGRGADATAARVMLDSLGLETATAAAKRPTVKTAAKKDVPALLRDPPWLDRPARTDFDPVELEPIEVKPSLDWRPGERDRVRATLPDPSVDQCWASECPACKKAKQRLPFAQHGRDAWEAIFRKKKGRLYWDYLAHGPADLVLSHWKRHGDDKTLTGYAKGNKWFAHGVAVALARHGDPIVANLLGILAEGPKARDWYELLGPIDGTEAGRIALGLLAKGGVRPRAVAVPWFTRHPSAGALVAIPEILGRTKLAGAGREALAVCIGAGHADAVKDAAKKYAKKSKRKTLPTLLQSAVSFDPLEHLPAKIPELPDFFAAERLPPIVLRRPKKKPSALPTAAVESFGTMLALGSLDAPYAGVAKIADACTPESLSEWSWAVFEAWLFTGSPPAHRWALHQLGWLGDDETVRRLVPLVRAWPGERAAARAVEGLRVLRAIGGELALMSLDDLGNKSRFDSIKSTANEMIERVAAELGLGREELADRLVPDLGLDARGQLTLDFGSRAFTVSFDEALRPVLTGADGKVVKRLPKAGKSDDADAAKLAAATFKALKKDVKALASSLIHRLEMAMITRRRWTADEWRRLFVEKPVVLNLSRRLLWAVYSGRGKKPKALFRVAEDGTLADAEDETFALADAVRVGLPHPIDLKQTQLELFGERFGEYEILPPFAQLSREVETASARDAKSTQLVSLKGIELPAPALVYGLERRRWERWGAEDGGAFYGHSKRFGDVTAHVTYQGAVGIGYIEETEILSIDRVQLGPSHGRGIPIADVDPIIISEVLRDVRALGS